MPGLRQRQTSAQVAGTDAGPVIRADHRAGGPDSDFIDVDDDSVSSTVQSPPPSADWDSMVLRRCTRCALPETHETIDVRRRGRLQRLPAARVQADADRLGRTRKRELDELIEQYRGKYDYDCIVPFSGGKDSTFTLYYLVKEYRLKPLVVQFDHGFMRPNARWPTPSARSRSSGVDYQSSRPNWRSCSKLMLRER